MADKKIKAKDAVNPFSRIEAAKPVPKATAPKTGGYKKPAPAPKSTMDYIMGGVEGVGNYLRGVNNKKK